MPAGDDSIPYEYTVIHLGELTYCVRILTQIVGSWFGLMKEPFTMVLEVGMVLNFKKGLNR